MNCGKILKARFIQMLLRIEGYSFLLQRQACAKAPQMSFIVVQTWLIDSVWHQPARIKSSHSLRVLDPGSKELSTLHPNLWPVLSGIQNLWIPSMKNIRSRSKAHNSNHCLAMSECAAYTTVLHVYKFLPICELSSTFTISKTRRDWCQTDVSHTLLPSR